MLRKLLGKGGTAARSSPPAVPDDTVVYAVGDIHGCADLLRELHKRIERDAARRDASRRLLVHIGDYVDRGHQTYEVVDLIAEPGLPGFETVNLMGNHDAWFLDVLENPEAVPAWLANGGQATLLSYSLGLPTDAGDGDKFGQLTHSLQTAVPYRHRSVLAQAKLSHQEGDYLFVHAGIRPRVPIGQQRAEDLLWIRDEFLESREDHGFVVVHGHTVVDEPQVHANRIAIDTGAYATGRLSALVLQGSERAFLSTGG